MAKVDSIVFALSADPPTDKDVTTRELTLTLNPGTPDESQLTKLTVPATTVDFTVDAAGEELAGPQNAFVKASLVDIDDSGNPADPDELSFQLLDTFPPTKAAGLGVRFVRETVVEVPDPVPAPEPTPEPTPPVDGGG